MTNHAALVQQLRSIALHHPLYAVGQVSADVHLLPYPSERVVLRMFAGRLHRGKRLQGGLQGHHFARRDTPNGHLRDDALQVAHAVELVVDQLAELRFAEEIFHDVESLVDGFLLFQRENHPTLQHSGPHRRDRPVDNVAERLAVFLHRIHQFQRAHGEFIQAHVLLLLDAGQRGDVSYLRMLRDFKVLQNGSAGNDAVVQMLHAEAFQVFHGEMAQQFLAGRLLGEHPVVEFEGEDFVAEILLEILLPCAVVEHFLRLEAAQQFFHIVVGALARQELAR